MKQEQFLSVVTAEEAERSLWEAVRPEPVGVEAVPLRHCLGRVLAQDVVSSLDVPAFDRSNVDGFAVRAQDTFGAEESASVFLKVFKEVIHTNVVPSMTLVQGSAASIATGGVLPRGADAVVMVEHTLPQSDGILVQRAAVPGSAISFAGTDIGAGETVLHNRTVLTSRETGVLAAIGKAEVLVYKRPQVAILSTGDEIIAPGEAMGVGKIFDSNGTIIADAVTELGCEPVPLGIQPDDEAKLRKAMQAALEYDFVLLSGGTSKGAGDLNYKVVEQMGAPGILVHGVALKPGKPLCLAMIGSTPLAILPGFPTSAVFTFHHFIAPVLRRMAGRAARADTQVTATLPLRVNSEKGRTEFLLLNLVQGQQGLSAYPMGKGSGSVTTFSKADGFCTIGRNAEYVEAGERVSVTLLGQDLRPAELIFIGSHCVGVDALMSRMNAQGWRTKVIAVGSQGGLAAAKRGECDIAGSHLLDEASGQYNTPFLDESLTLRKGYGRTQGLVFRADDPRFAERSLDECLALIQRDSSLAMINRNRGSGTRILVDKLLKTLTPEGFFVEAKSHNAVAAAVAQSRADWGVAIANVAAGLKLGFLPLLDEEYDFAIPLAHLERPAVKAFLALLEEEPMRQTLRNLGLVLKEQP